MTSKEKSRTLLYLNRATNAIEILENPYWLRDEVYVGRNLRTDEISAADVKDLFYYEGELIDLLREIRFGKQSFITLHDLKTREPRSMSYSHEGHCSIWIPEVGYFHIFFHFDKNIKLKENTLVLYCQISDVYTVTTTYSRVDKVHYTGHVPKGKSYTTIREALECLGPSTIAEIAKHVGWDANRVSARISELSKSGEVYKTGLRKSGFGINNHVWAIR